MGKKFVMVVQEVGKPRGEKRWREDVGRVNDSEFRSWENGDATDTLDQKTSEATALIANFNNTLKPHESARELVGVEVEDCEDMQDCECGSGELIGMDDDCCIYCFDDEDDEDEDN